MEIDPVERRAARAARFATADATTPRSSAPSSAISLGLAPRPGLSLPLPAETQQLSMEVIASAEPILGTATNLEKPYLRLTRSPHAHEVRPLAVLRKALTWIKSKWVAGQDYAWVADQLKSLRQDLTVQHIVTPLTVEAYETHARLALEEADMDSYLQCVSRLRELVASGQKSPHRIEFVAYAILFQVCCTGASAGRVAAGAAAASLMTSVPTDCAPSSSYAAGDADAPSDATGSARIAVGHRSQTAILLKALTRTELRHPAVAHAVAVARAVTTGDFFQFFSLYDNAPNMGVFLMQHLIDDMRLLALRYSPTPFPLSFLCWG